MKKLMIKIAVTVIILLILFIPIPHGTYKDGGTKDFSALTYRIVVWNRINAEIDKGNNVKKVTYHKTSVFRFPDNFKSIDELWEIETENNQN